jgi:hypothetical protein
MATAVDGIEKVGAQLFQIGGAHLAFDMEHLFHGTLLTAMFNEIGQHDVAPFINSQEQHPCLNAN